VRQCPEESVSAAREEMIMNKLEIFAKLEALAQEMEPSDKDTADWLRIIAAMQMLGQQRYFLQYISPMALAYTQALQEELNLLQS
jgi:hypothetical protein